MLSLGESEMSSYRVKEFILPCKFMYEEIQKISLQKISDADNDKLTFFLWQDMETWGKQGSGPNGLLS